MPYQKLYMICNRVSVTRVTRGGTEPLWMETELLWVETELLWVDRALSIEYNNSTRPSKEDRTRWTQKRIPRSPKSCRR